ncbi:MAG TPA: hypothetical protein VFS40_04530 [Gemmatimonadales bacterium]|nr:hypothetical protein [Gemmatimonadales bacterium]
MPPDLAVAPRPAPTRARDQRAVARLLDTTFGFLVWAVHLLAIYIVQALACEFGVARPHTHGPAGLVPVLLLLTAAAACVVVLHALRRRRRRHEGALPFRVAVTVGADAIATLAIVGQCFVILLVPPCA